MRELAIRLPPAMRSRAFVSRLLFGGLTILLGAGIVHILVVLLVPRFAANDGFARLSAASSGPGLTIIDRPKSTGAVSGLDPLFVHGACRIDISQRAAELTFRGDGKPWLMALYDPQNAVSYSLNDRALPDGNLDMLLVTPAQNARLRESAPQSYNEKVVLELTGTSYAAILRVYSPTDDDRKIAEALLKQGRCNALDLEVEP